MAGKHVAQPTEAQIAQDERDEKRAMYAEDRAFSQWEADGRGEDSSFGW